MKYDVIIVGAGPCGYLAAYELKELNSNLKVLVIDKGLEITQRKCPVLLHKLDKCPVNKEGRQECFPACSITNGFGGAGAYSDGKFNITTEFGGWLNDYIDDTELLDLINYEDKINLKFGATDIVTDPYTDKIKEIEKKAMSVGVKLLRSKVRHLGTEENLKILERIYKHLKESVDFMFRTEVEQVILVDNVAKGVVLKNGEVIDTLADELPYDLNSDLIKIEDKDYGVFFIDSYDHKDRYENKKINLNAVCYMQTDGSVVVGRLAMTCCENDIQLLGFFTDIKEMFKANEWINLTATIKYEMIDGEEEPVLKVIEYKRIKQIKDAVITL